MWEQILPGLRIKLFLTLLLGVVYPLVMTGISQVLFSKHANGSLITAGGKVIGSEIIAQGFTKPEYFQPRPSAAGSNGYDATSSGGSQFGPTNQKLIDRVKTSVEQFRKDNPDYQGPIPADLVTTSASGLDPHLSPASALAQAPRVAKARGMSVDQANQLVAEFTEGPTLGILGEPRVNVLKMNLALDQRFPAQIARISSMSKIFLSQVGAFVWLIAWNVAYAQSLPALPGMSRPLLANPNPMRYDAGPLGKVYVTGAISGLGQWQNNVFPGDREWNMDLSNGQIFLNKIEGVVQYFVQLGAYSIPDLGLPYIRARDAIDAFYGPFPQGFLKLAPTSNFSISAGKLPTLIGAEYTFSFENMNIQRGLLWNQENAVNRGVQVNYTAGAVALAGSWNDGFYSNQYSWASLSAAWTVNKSNTLTFAGGGNTRHSTKATLATLLFQNNEQIYNLIYTSSSGPWTFQPYFQYTHVPRIPEIGALQEASTYGGAVLANYTFPQGSKIGALPLTGASLPVRFEYIASTGSLENGAPNLLYGPGSKAWSATITPTWQRNIFFARAELSFVGTMDTTPGLAFGPRGTDRSQTRVLLEGGILF